jgi:hypothetical protein
MGKKTYLQYYLSPRHFYWLSLSSSSLPELKGELQDTSLFVRDAIHGLPEKRQLYSPTRMQVHTIFDHVK